ncbi:MAG TPA: glycosyltransferase family 39 protein, partial [Ktedonobacterales bacterium]
MASAGRHASPVATRLGQSLLMLVGLAGAIAGQVMLSRHAEQGEGVVTAQLDPSAMTLSLVSALAVAAALSWPALHDLWPPHRLAGRPHLPGLGALLTGWLSHSGQGMLALSRTRRGRGILVGLTLALATSLVADLNATAPATRPTAQWWWLASVLILVLTSSLVRVPAKPQQWGVHPVPRWSLRADGLALAALTGLALLLRLPDLTGVPVAVQGDEAMCGLQALLWLHGQVPSLLDTGWNVLPVGGYGLPALVMSVAGASLFGLRLSSVVIGTLSIFCVYALTREFASRGAALLAAGLLTVAHLHVHFSRMGIHNIHAVFAVTLTLWLFTRALRTGDALVMVLAGVAMSLSAQVYWGARIVFIVIPLFLVALLALSRQTVVKRVLVLAWLTLSGAVALGPLAVFLVRASDVASRTDEVFIFSSSPLVRDHLISIFGSAAPGPALLRGLVTLPMLLGGLSDQGFQYGAHSGMLDPVVAALATIGIFFALFSLRRPPYLLLALWVLVTIIFGSLLTIDQPWWPRLIVMLPALCILAALVADDLARHFATDIAQLATSLHIPGHPLQVAALSSVLACAVVGVSTYATWQHY